MDIFKKGDKVIIDPDMVKPNEYQCIGEKNFYATYPDLKGIIEDVLNEDSCMVKGKTLIWALPMTCLKKQD